ncbi:MAG: FUSC family protein [Azospirillaceae bacterium]|nr:FUSC family protein [Azospirillaceae bacterium]
MTATIALVRSVVGLGGRFPELLRRRIVMPTGWLPLPPPGWAHAARTCLAALLALYLAYVFELDSPSSAAVTVFIVAHPVHGMVWSKCLYRGGGTLIGGLIALILAACFAQTPILYLAVFGVWVGCCTAAATVLRNFRSYGAVLAGYTVGLISLPGVAETPDRILTLAANRVAVVMLGVMCSALVGSLLSRRQTAGTLTERLRRSLLDLMTFIDQALSGDRTVALSARHGAVRATVLDLDNLIEFAALETAAMSRQADAQRASVVAMLGALTAASAAHDALMTAERRPGPYHEVLTRAVAAVRIRLADLIGLLRAGDRVATVDGARRILTELGAIRDAVEVALSPQDVTTLIAQDRLCELLDAVTAAIDGAIGVNARPVEERGAIVIYHRDWRWAAVNGLRATAAVWLAGLLWIATAWPAGAAMVMTTVPNVALLAQRDRPGRDAMAFVKGTVLAAALALVYLVFVIPQIDNFPLLALVLTVTLFPAMLVSLNPKSAFIGLGILVFFPTFLAPGNPMHYDVVGLLNTALAMIAGAALAALIYALILPVNPRRQVRDLVRAIVRDVQALPRLRRPLPPAAWETRMHVRLLRLGARIRASDVDQDGLMQGGYAALRVGREILRLQVLRAQLAPLSPAVQATVAPVLKALRALRAGPEIVAHQADDAAQALVEVAATNPELLEARVARVVASLLEISLLLRRYRYFFRAALSLMGKSS